MSFAPYPKLRNLNVKTANMLRLKYLNQVAPYSEDLDVLNDPMNPKRVSLQDRYSQYPGNILRWRVQTNMSKPTLLRAVLRNRLKRKWAQAFGEALRTRGYGLDGRFIVKGSTNGAVVGRERPDLRGTLEINVFGGQGFMTPFERLVAQAGSTLDALKSKQNDRMWSIDGVEETRDAKTKGKFSTKKISHKERPAEGRGEEEALNDPIMDAERGRRWSAIDPSIAGNWQPFRAREV